MRFGRGRPFIITAMGETRSTTWSRALSWTLEVSNYRSAGEITTFKYNVSNFSFFFRSSRFVLPFPPTPFGQSFPPRSLSNPRPLLRARRTDAEPGATGFIG